MREEERGLGLGIDFPVRAVAGPSSPCVLGSSGCFKALLSSGDLGASFALMVAQTGLASPTCLQEGTGGRVGETGCGIQSREILAMPGMAKAATAEKYMANNNAASQTDPWCHLPRPAGLGWRGSGSRDDLGHTRSQTDAWHRVRQSPAGVCTLTCPCWAPRAARHMCNDARLYMERFGVSGSGGTWECLKVHVQRQCTWGYAYRCACQRVCISVHKGRGACVSHPLGLWGGFLVPSPLFSCVVIPWMPKGRVNAGQPAPSCAEIMGSK